MPYLFLPLRPLHEVLSRFLHCDSRACNNLAWTVLLVDTTSVGLPKSFKEIICWLPRMPGKKSCWPLGNGQFIGIVLSSSIYK